MASIQKTTVFACDFCGKDQSQVELMIVSQPAAAICNECVEVCNLVIAEKRVEALANTAQPATENVAHQGV